MRKVHITNFVSATPPQKKNSPYLEGTPPNGLSWATKPHSYATLVSVPFDHTFTCIVKLQTKTDA